MTGLRFGLPKNAGAEEISPLSSAGDAPQSRWERPTGDCHKGGLEDLGAEKVLRPATKLEERRCVCVGACAEDMKRVRIAGKASRCAIRLVLYIPTWYVRKSIEERPMGQVT